MLSVGAFGFADGSAALCRDPPTSEQSCNEVVKIPIPKGRSASFWDLISLLTCEAMTRCATLWKLTPM